MKKKWSKEKELDLQSISPYPRSFLDDEDDKLESEWLDSIRKEFGDEVAEKISEIPALWRMEKRQRAIGKNLEERMKILKELIEK